MAVRDADRLQRLIGSGFNIRIQADTCHVQAWRKTRWKRPRDLEHRPGPDGRWWGQSQGRPVHELSTIEPAKRSNEFILVPLDAKENDPGKMARRRWFE